MLRPHSFGVAIAARKKGRRTRSPSSFIGQCVNANGVAYRTGSDLHPHGGLRGMHVCEGPTRPATCTFPGRGRGALLFDSSLSSCMAGRMAGCLAKATVKTASTGTSPVYLDKSISAAFGRQSSEMRALNRGSGNGDASGMH